MNDNPEGYWFKRKIYGWGWTPVTWQGWLTMGVFILLMVLNFNRIESYSYSESDILINFIPQTIILMAVLIFICYKKGEKPRWQWGIPKKEE
ncbi:MAG: hypothetical protein KBC06_02445 [Candidatus Pacebacteria bacterium]|nr:hypothetical protein [Candidatus Paceibacterota bacterium]